MKPTFGEWLRWTIARRGIDRTELRQKLQCSPKTITNLYRRQDPDGISDVFLSRLAFLLGLTEPELLTKWKDGLPPLPEAAEPAGEQTKKTRAKKAG
jgi:hypothetical protein